MADASSPPQPPLAPAQIACVIVSAIRYEVPANALLAVAEQERGRPGQRRGNDNGTVDIGPMQFNSAYLRQLERFGIQADHVDSWDCYPYLLAAWRIKNHLVNDRGPFWTRVANYHSRTPHHNQRYATSVAVKARHWGEWIERHYPTRTMDANAAAQLPSARPSSQPPALAPSKPPTTPGSP